MKMESYKILIVEDDAHIAESLQDILECLDHEVVAIYDNGEEALEYLETIRPDLIMLDIQLKGKMDGVTVADRIGRRHQIPFIFTTAFADEDTIRRARDRGPFGYIVKPYGMKDIYAGLEVAMNNYRLIQEMREEQARSSMVGQAGHIYLKVDTRLVKVNDDDILYVEAKGDYVLFKTTEKGLVVNSTMKKVEDKLNPNRFIRVHRSFIVNLNKIEDIEDATLVINSKVIPISRANRENLMSRITTL